jgi:hypothetical protein
MSNLLKDPLVHFLLIGGALFAVFYMRGDDTAQGGQRIVFEAEQVERLRNEAALLRGRQPTADELRLIVEPAIRDEVMYREALALGLDVEDDQVRDRLIEKMRYLTEDLADPEPASEEALRAFFDASPQLFLIPDLVTFDQKFFSPRERGERLRADVDAALAALTAGQDGAELGDRTPLQDRFVAAPRGRVEVLFGAAMTDAVFSAPPGEWRGPFESDFGLHLVRVVERSDARQPNFEDVREIAREIYAEQRRAEANRAAYERIRADYDVVVEWPDTVAEPAR